MPESSEATDTADAEVTTVSIASDATNTGGDSGRSTASNNNMSTNSNRCNIVHADTSQKIFQDKNKEVGVVLELLYELLTNVFLLIVFRESVGNYIVT